MDGAGSGAAGLLVTGAGAEDAGSLVGGTGAVGVGVLVAVGVGVGPLVDGAGVAVRDRVADGRGAT